MPVTQKGDILGDLLYHPKVLVPYHPITLKGDDTEYLRSIYPAPSLGTPAAGIWEKGLVYNLYIWFFCGGDFEKNLGILLSFNEKFV